MSAHKTSGKELAHLHEIERLAREAAKASGITRALDQAIHHGQRDAKDYGYAFDAVADIADAVHTDLARLADEINADKWK